jgi:hypothetical protein
VAAAQVGREDSEEADVEEDGDRVTCVLQDDVEEEHARPP